MTVPYWKGIVPPPLPRRRSTDEIDWRKAAPRWLLLAAVSILIAFALFQSGRISEMESKQQQRIEAAIVDAPTKYQARLSERVADVEGEARRIQRRMDQMEAAVQRLAEKLESAAIATERLNGSVNALTREMQANRR